MLVKDFSPNARVHWLSDINALRVEWLKLHMSLDTFQNIVGQALGILKEHQGSVWIADSYESKGVFPKEIQDIIQNDDMTTFAKEAGLKMVLSVMPKESGLASMSTKKWTKETEENGHYAMRQFPDLESCKDWITKS